MPGLVHVLSAFLPLFLLHLHNCTLTLLLIPLVLVHDLLYASFHHAEVLFRVDVFCFGLVLKVLNLSDVALLFLVGLDAVVDAGGRTGGLVEEALETD